LGSCRGDVISMSAFCDDEHGTVASIDIEWECLRCRAWWVDSREFRLDQPSQAEAWSDYCSGAIDLQELQAHGKLIEPQGRG